MNWEQLIAIARLLAESPRHGEARGRPQQARLRKAISAAYYAVFHALANSNADTLIGASPQFRSLPAWTQTYRALGHGFAKSQIQSGLNSFPLARIHRMDTDGRREDSGRGVRELQAR